MPNHKPEIYRQFERAEGEATRILEQVMHRQRWSAQVHQELTEALVHFARDELDYARGRKPRHQLDAA